MKNNLLQALKNSSRLTFVFTVIFLIGVLYSSYKLFTLPHDLVYYGSVTNVSLATAVFVKLGIVIIITFLIGMAAIGTSVQVKKETIVYIEKKKEIESQLETKEAATTESDILDVESFKKSLTSTNNSNLLQEGLNKICDAVQAGQGAIYVPVADEKREVELAYGFAVAVAETTAPRFEFGEGLVGQVAASGTSVYLDEIPEGYITIISGLGTSSPRYLFIAPIKKGEVLKGVLEVATFQVIPSAKRKQLEEMAGILAQRLN